MNRIPLLLLAVALVLSACGGTSAATTEYQSGASAATAAPAAEQSTADGVMNAPQGSNGSNEQAQPQPATDQQGFNRLVIKTADVSIEVADVRAAEAAIRTRVATLGGYIVQSQSNGSDEYMSMNISFRVPVTQFETALGDLQGVAEKVLSSAVRGDDVTEEFVDLESRQKTLEATRDRLLTLLERAETVEDTLLVNQTLTDIQSQIDQIEGRSKYLSQSAAMSTVNVAITPIPAVAPIIAEEGWQPLTIARDALRELLVFGQGLANVVIVLLVWSPVWLVLLLGGLWLARKARSTLKT